MLNTDTMIAPAAPGVDTRGRACSATGGTAPCAFRTLGEFEDLSGKVGLVEVIQCVLCGLGVTHPPIADVSFLYEGRESQDFQQDGSRLAHGIKRFVFRRQAKALLRQIGTRPARTLDFGCGSGLFTRCLGDVLGPDTVTGSDFDGTSPPDLAGRLYVPMAHLALYQASFDLVLAMHVLEHDDDPRALLGRIAAMARPGGVIVIEVPNVQCVWTRVFKKKWDAWYLPFHRTHFSRGALRALAQEAGLQVVARHDMCVPTMGRSLSNMFGGNKGLFWLLAGIAAHPVQWIGEKLSGRPSALRIILKRPA